MEDLRSPFTYQENVEELKQKVLSMASELQSARIQAEEQSRKNKQAMDTIRQLLHLLQIAYKERDEARAHLHKLLLRKPVISHGGDSMYDVVGGLNAANPPQKAARIAERESEVVAEIAKGRALPKKGKLLNAVMEAGPLLQTLMVAGPLPRWLNPPPPPAESAEEGTQLTGTCPNDAVWTSSLGGVGNPMIAGTKRQRLQRREK